MSERVIAIDPGERAGWASATLRENSISAIQHGVLPCRDMAVELAMRQALVADTRRGSSFENETRDGDYNVIVYETWRPRPVGGSMKWIQGNQLLSAQLVGQIRLVGWLSGAKLKGYGPDRKTPAMASMPGRLRFRMDQSHEQHDQDALMHLWMYALENWVTDPRNVTIEENT